MYNNKDVLNDLETMLGDPKDASNLFSYESAVNLDETEDFPEESVHLLNEWGLNQHYVPVSVGGELGSLELLVELARKVARRDITLAIGHGKTMLGSTPVWISGNDEQKEVLKRYILDGDPISFGVTERDHGSDLTANKVVAERSGNGDFYINGEKWIINNATRNKALTLIAKTSAKFPALNYSMFFIEKRKIYPNFECLPKIKTHGIKCADISGIIFNNAKATQKDIIGKEGEGLAVALKTIQITKTLCAGLSLGGADTALRLAIDYSNNRDLYGVKVIDIHHSRAILVRCFASILISDCLLKAMTRTFHFEPTLMSVYSSLVKYFIPNRLEKSVKELSGFLGSRYFIREDIWGGIFEKITRDMALIPIFDSSSVVNLKTMAQQLPQIANSKHTFHGESLKNIFDLSTPVDEFCFKKLKTNNFGKDLLLYSTSTIKGYIDRDWGDGVDITELECRAESLFKQVDKFLIDSADMKIQKTLLSVKEHEIADRYSLIISAISCLHIYFHNKCEIDNQFNKNIGWLLYCMDMILNELSPDRFYVPDSQNETNIFSIMINKFNKNQLFSIQELELR